jgi:hypothetical protein
MVAPTVFLRPPGYVRKFGTLPMRIRPQGLIRKLTTYEEFIGTKKHLVLGLLTHTGPLGSN